ncbi:hypothetical protein CALVIDRAFT_306956 [Calocera viscosa TUFC12733]|uniref:Hydrophobin n=1 Tax=Calocera viscosa (strain TUFC12733) TaxID=1330018 RepID=A0A167IBH5_CALVF|nr:hypothetical protein CALVIDRAFT_306956 [Calocera viscosa TUFC12733]
MRCFLRMLFGLSVLFGAMAALPGALSGRLGSKGSTNAERLARGLHPGRPNRLYDPTRVPSALNGRSSVLPSTCPSLYTPVCCDYVGLLENVPAGLITQVEYDYLLGLGEPNVLTVCIGYDQLLGGKTICPSNADIAACCNGITNYLGVISGIFCNAA